MVVGQIVDAKIHPSADRLYVLSVQMVQDVAAFEAKAALEAKNAPVKTAEEKKKTRKPKKGAKVTKPVIIPVREIVSGLAEYYTVEELVGKKVVVLCNLAPRKFQGVNSFGMLLTAIQETPIEGSEPPAVNKVIGLLTTEAAIGTQVLPEGYKYEHKKALKMPKELNKLQPVTDADGNATCKGELLKAKGVAVVAEKKLANCKIG